MAARRDRNRHRRRRGRFGFLYKLLSFLIILTALLVGCVAFFRVNEITVAGNSRYSAQEIIDASGVELGNNLCLINAPQTSQNILGRLPYVKTVAPVRRLPDTLELKITETVAAAALETEEGWWLVDAGGKLLETGEESIRGELPLIMGIIPVTPTLGMPMAVELAEQTRLDSVEGLLTALDERGMAGNVKGFIDLTSASTLYFGYGEALTVAMPMNGDFQWLVFALQRAIEALEQQGETVTGTLDLTYGGDEARLLTEQWLPQSGNWKG